MGYGVHATVVLLLTSLAGMHGQTPVTAAAPGLSLQERLKQLAATSESLQRDLPDFTCEEKGLSQAIKKNKVKEHAEFVADLRVERSGAGRLVEHLQIKEVDGKPFTGRGFYPPFMVEGGFGESLFFFLPTMQTCFNFTMEGNRIDFGSPPGTFERTECGESGAPRGFVLLDAAGNVRHLERQVPAAFAQQVHVVDFTAIDFTPVELDGKIYPLAAKVVAEVPKDGRILHFEAAYSGCHLFRATSRVLPDITPVPDDVPAGPHP
jgi:hypothetical protein